ncbi:hypothetical protein [Corynebacterium sp. AOP12-C2-36]|uniref:hypothetical protein n=1 Tax=Corynebacterium sp. AOP12-C2-36 TaxID=3457723 RepID=UPI004033A77B
MLPIDDRVGGIIEGAPSIAVPLAMFWLICALAAANPPPTIWAAAVSWVRSWVFIASKPATPAAEPVAADPIWAAVAASNLAWKSKPRALSMFFVLKMFWACIAAPPALFSAASAIAPNWAAELRIFSPNASAPDPLANCRACSALRWNSGTLLALSADFCSQLCARPE